MSPSRRQFIYWDTSVFIALIKGEASAEADRATIAQAILRAAEAGKIELVTSAFTRAEVRRDRRRPKLTPEQHNRVSAFFKHSYLHVRPLDRAIGESAAELGERYDLKPADAVHLATALSVKADELQHWDDNDFGKLPLRTDPPPIKITHPTVPPVEAPGNEPAEQIALPPFDGQN